MDGLFTGDERNTRGCALWLANSLLLEGIVTAVVERSIEYGRYEGGRVDLATTLYWSVLAYEGKVAQRVAGQRPPRVDDVPGTGARPEDHLSSDADDGEALRAFMLANLVAAYACPAGVATEEAIAFARMNLHQIDAYVDAVFRFSTVSPAALAGVLATPAAVRSGWL